MRRPPRAPIPALLLASLLAAPARAAPQLVASFDDPAGDATGPGSYVPPASGDFTDGDFDLRRFQVFADGGDVVFEVTLGAAFRRPEVTRRSNSSEIPLWNNLYFQNIDIYIDTDPASPAGFTSCIPGRRVAFEAGRTWKSAVVLTPQPGPARAISSEALGPAAARVLFPEDLRVRSRTVIARVPASALGGPPRRSWGYSVHLSGASWERSFGVVDRLRGTREVNAYTMPVLPVPEPWAFGGAPEGEAHPRVVDVLLPAGADQKTVLGSFDAKTGAFARVPFVYAEPPPPPPRPASSPESAAQPGADGRQPPELSVQYVAGTMVSLSGPVAGLRPMQFGRVLGADGSTAARVVIVQVLDAGVVASAVEGLEKIARGARVRFDPPEPARQP